MLWSQGDFNLQIEDKFHRSYVALRIIYDRFGKLSFVELISSINGKVQAHYIVFLKDHGSHLPHSPYSLSIVLIKWDEFKL